MKKQKSKFLAVLLFLVALVTGLPIHPATAAEAPVPSLGEYHVAAYYWPAYHDEPSWRPFFRGTGPGGNEGEWEIIRKAKPKFEGHHQPHVPLWGYEDATDPQGDWLDRWKSFPALDSNSR